VLADIPGLIEGAHEGAGLGTRFLGHVERCRVLLHLIDVTTEDVEAAYHVVRGELDAYGAGLGSKTEIVALTKCDAVDEETICARARNLKAVCGKEPLQLSAVTREGLMAVLYAITKEINTDKAEKAKAATEPKPWRP